MVKALKPQALCPKPIQGLLPPWHKRALVSTPKSMTHIIDEPIEEELLRGDRLSRFHQTRPGEVLDGRFKTISKLGYGTSSTVWLAENLRL